MFIVVEQDKHLGRSAAGKAGDAILQSTLCECLFFQGNVGPAAFWLLGYLLTNHEALTAVEAEMATLEISTPDTPVGTPVFGETVIHPVIYRNLERDISHINKVENRKMLHRKNEKREIL